MTAGSTALWKQPWQPRELKLLQEFCETELVIAVLRSDVTGVRIIPENRWEWISKEVNHRISECRVRAAGSGWLSAPSLEQARCHKTADQEGRYLSLFAERTHLRKPKTKPPKEEKAKINQDWEEKEDRVIRNILSVDRRQKTPNNFDTLWAARRITHQFLDNTALNGRTIRDVKKRARILFHSMYP